MKKILQKEIRKTYCDFTGKEITPDAEGGSIHLNLLFFKSQMPEIEKDDGLTKKEVKENSFDYYETCYLEFDCCEKVAIEIFEFLAKKYPKKVKKVLSDASYNNIKNVNALKVCKRSDYSLENKYINDAFKKK